MSDVFAYEITGPGSDLFGIIDLTTGVFASLGSMSVTLAGLGSYGGVIYGGADHGNTLYSINTSNGALTAVGIGNIGGGYALIGSTASGLYALGWDDALYSINAATGAATEIGPTGIPVGTVMGMSAGSNTLYVTTNNSLYALNTTNGSATFIGSTTEGESGFGALVSVGGTLYGGAYGASTPDIYTVDPQSGAATFVAASPSTPSSTGVAGFWGLAPVSVTFTTVTVGTTYGGVANIYPFMSSLPLDYEQVYSSTAFSGPISFNTITFFDTQIPGSVVATGNYDITFSYTSSPLNSNYPVTGTGTQTFFDGVLGGQTGTSFSISGIPFFYDPSLGNLLIDVHVTDQTIGGSGGFDRDGFTSVVSRAWAANGGTYSDNSGLVTQFSTEAITIPAVSAIAETPSTGDLNAGKTVTITLTTSEAVTVTGTPTLALNDNGTATYDAGKSTATSLVFDYTVGSSDADLPSLQVTSLNLPNGATIQDGGGNNLSLSLSSVPTYSGPKIDTTPPATPAAPFNNAVVNGYVNAANDTATQTLTGSAENGSTVTVYDNGTQVGTATADPSTGAWSVPIGQLPNGSTHSYAVTATDAAGNVSQPSAALNFVVDTTAPGVVVSINNTDVNVANPTGLVTFTFSKPPTDFSLNDVTSADGSLSNLSGSGTTYTATFTANAGVDDNAATVSVINGSYHDVAGNAGTGGSTMSSVVKFSSAVATFYEIQGDWAPSQMIDGIFTGPGGNNGWAVYNYATGVSEAADALLTIASPLPAGEYELTFKIYQNYYGNPGHLLGDFALDYTTAASPTLSSPQTPVSIQSASSLNGTTFSLLSPGELLANTSQNSIGTDTYTISALIDSASPITGIFLDAIKNPALPGGGPGGQ